MLKHIQTKLILIYLAIGLIIILGLGASFFVSLYHLQGQLGTEAWQSTAEISQLLGTQITQIQVVLCIFILVFCIIMALVGFYVSRSIIAPIQKLVKKVTEITDDDKIRFEKAIKELTIEISKRFSTDNINWDDEIKAVVGKCEREEDEEGKMLKIQERLSKLNEEVIKLVEKWMDTMSPITLLNEGIDSLIKVKGEKKKEGFEKESKEIQICMITWDKKSKIW